MGDALLTAVFVADIRSCGLGTVWSCVSRPNPSLSIPSQKKTRPYRGEAEIGRGDGRICQRQIARAQKDSVGVRVGRRDADAGTRLFGLRDGGVCIWMVFHGGGGAVTHALGDADALSAGAVVNPGLDKAPGGHVENGRIVGIFAHVEGLGVHDRARIVDGGIVDRGIVDGGIVRLMFLGLRGNGRARAVSTMGAAMGIGVLGRVITGDLAIGFGAYSLWGLGAFDVSVCGYAVISTYDVAVAFLAFGFFVGVSGGIVTNNVAIGFGACAHRGLGTFDVSVCLDAVISTCGFAIGGKAFRFGKSIGGGEEGKGQGHRKGKSYIHVHPPSIIKNPSADATVGGRKA